MQEADYKEAKYKLKAVFADSELKGFSQSCGHDDDLYESHIDYS